MLCCAYVNILHVVGLQPLVSDSAAASVTVKSPIERIQSFFSSAHESRLSLSMMSALSLVSIISLLKYVALNIESLHFVNCVMFHSAFLFFGFL